MKVEDHKTSLAYGAAKLVMDSEVSRWFVAFRDILRPQLAPTGPNEPLFVTSTGQRVSHLSTDITNLASKIGDRRVLGPTAVGMATATITAGLAGDVERRLIANQMGHSAKTANLYYTSLGDNDRRVEVYQVMGRMRKKALRIDSSTDEEEDELVVKKAKRCKYTADEEEEIRTYFVDKEKVTLSDARSFWTAIPILKDLQNRSRIK